MPNIGYKQTEEHKERIRRKLFGKQNSLNHPLSNITKKRISIGGKRRYKEHPVSDITKDKLRIAAIEQFKDLEQREIRSGENCPFYKDGRGSGENSNRTTTSEHIRWAKKIRKRDNHICQLCGEEGFCAHHIDYDPDNFDEDNGVCLCRRCHAKTNINREIWIEFFQILMVIIRNENVIRIF